MAEIIDIQMINRNLLRLKSILEQETIFLKQNNPASLADLYEEKLEILQVLENQKKLMKAKSSPIDRNSDAARQLVNLSKEIDRVIEQYGKELIKAREVNKYVMEAIARALQEHFKQVGSYDAKGNEGQYLPKGESSVPPMKVNSTF